MRDLNQAIEHPFGITVFGSSLIRVEPDIASVKFAVERLAPHPRESFAAAREGAQAVRAFLAEAGVRDVGVSRIGLRAEFKYVPREENKFIGYAATVAFHVVMTELDQLEPVLSGIVDAGVNRINEVDLVTSRLKELRAEARRRAIDAAREKAENYCSAAGVTLGRVLHIEDTSPDVLRSRGAHGARGDYEIDEDPAPRAFDPGNIVVGGAVMVAFAIAHPLPPLSNS